MSVYFGSDLHLGHTNICSFRPKFKTPEEHDEAILYNIRRTLTKRDKVFLLGDNCFTKAAFDALMDEIPKGCVVHYFPGNHEFERDLTIQYVASRVDKLDGLLKYKQYWLSHAPIHPMELRGKKNIHGHTHSDLMGEDYINVCMEHTGYGLIQLENLREFQEETTMKKQVIGKQLMLGLLESQKQCQDGL